MKNLDMMEIEPSARSDEDEEETRKQKNVNVAIASLVSGRQWET